MTQVIANNIDNILKYKEKILNFLFFGILACSIFYVYFLHNAISNVVAREKLVKENRTLSTQVSELEAKYFSVKNSINIELAYAKGFRNSDKVSFISKNSVTAMADKNGL